MAEPDDIDKAEVRDQKKEKISDVRESHGFSGGSIVIKMQDDGTGNKYGPYAWLVSPPSEGREWHYLGSVGGQSTSRPSSKETQEQQDAEEFPVVERVVGDLEGNEPTFDMDWEIRDGEIYAEATTGNKAFVGVAKGWENGEIDLDFAAFQRGKTKHRDSGTAEIEVGDIVKGKRWSHSGQNCRSKYAVFDGDNLVEIDADEAREIVYRRYTDVPSKGVVVNNKDRLNVDNSRDGDGWVQRINDYDPAEYHYNWDSEFVNDPITAYNEGDVIRTSRDDHYVIQDGELVEVDEQEAQRIAAQ